MKRINLKYWKDNDIKKQIPDNFVKRELCDTFYNVINSGKIIALYGPRQSGKTSLLWWAIQKLLIDKVPSQNINYATMDFIDLHTLLADTKKFMKLLKEESDQKGKIYLFIDEIQRIDNAGLLLKQIYDSRNNIQVIISGSSILGIKDKVKEHLTGRKIDFTLYPFSFLEFLKAKQQLPDDRIRKYEIKEIKELINLYGDRLFSLWNEYVIIGGYPEIVISRSRRDWLYSSLFSTYLERDVSEFISAANYQKFQDYVQLIASEIGSIYNRQAISRTLGRDVRTIEKFEDILIVTFIIYKLSPFYTNIRKELSKAPRFYFIDTGLRNFILGENYNTQSGGLLENAIIAEMIKEISDDYKLYWWRTKGGAEVDLIIKGKKEIIPVEIKGIKDLRPKITRSFVSFLEKYSPKKAFFITPTIYREENYNKTKIFFIPAYITGLLDMRLTL